MHARQGLCAGILLAVALALAAPAEAAPKRELQARQEFAAGRYANALELFAQLYAETLHPTYLRNIGRCHQELGDPDKAIASFRLYLAKAKDLKPSERQEVEGYIHDMEELKRKREADTRPAPPPPPPISLAARNTEAPPPAMVSRAPEPPPESTPVYGRWWFWAIVGGAAVAGTAALWASGALGGKSAKCPTGVVCQ
jgi:hypothetical protein